MFELFTGDSATFLMYQLRYVALPLALLGIMLIILYRVFLAADWSYKIHINNILRSHPDDTDIHETAKYRKAKAEVMTWLAIFIATIIVSIKALNILSVNIDNILPVATVVAAGVGFGSQWLFKDVIQGALIITEKQYGLGDIIIVTSAGSKDGISGTVESLTLRMTKIRTVTGDLVSISNRNIEQVINQSAGHSVAIVDIPIPPPPKADTEKAIEILKSVGTKLWNNPHYKKLMLEEPTAIGIEKITPHYYLIRIRVDTKPSQQWEVQRELNKVAIQSLSDEGISLVDIKAIPEVGQ